MSNSLKYCPSYSVPLSAESDGNHLIYKPRCKRWSCPYCSVQNRKIWRARIMSEIESTPDVKTWYFWTLTLLGKDHTGIKHSFSVWQDNWHKLRKRLKRDLGKMRYVRVFEMHKDGTLHVHMMTDKSYDDCIEIKATKKQKSRRESKTLRSHLNDLGLGYIHDIKEIITDNEENNGIARNVSAYIVKYMTKDSMQYVREVLKDAGSKIRVIQPSHGFYNETKKDPLLDWKVEPVYVETLLSLPYGKRVEDITTKQIITIDDFYEHEHYPNRTSDLVDIADNEKGDYENENPT